MGHKTTATNLFLISAALIFMVFLVIVGRPALYAEATTTAMGYTDQPTPIPVDGVSSDDSSKSLLKQETEHLVYSTEINRFLTVEYKPNRITNFVEPDTQIDPTSLFTFEIGSISVTNVNNPSTYPTRLMTYDSMKNPASAYCVELGYDSSIITSEDGSQHNICKLPNGTFCDGWDFFAGKCGQAYSYCANQGLVTVTLENGQNQFSPEYAVCADKNGNVVGRVTEMMNLYGLLRGEPGLIDRFEGPPEPPMDFTDADLPSTFDWRDHLGSDWTTPVKDQQNCGSCWAFSAVGVSETVLNIANNSPDLDIDLSEQYLVTDCALAEGSCAGGSKGAAMNFIRDSGIPDEACFPYGEVDCTYTGLGACDTTTCTYDTGDQCSDFQCSDRCTDWASRLHTIDSVTYLGYFPDIDTIKTALIDHSPVAVSMNMGGTFSGGIYSCSDNINTGHAVIIVGYNDAGGYWIVKNSWGDTWNGDGFFNVAYDNCAIHKYPYYAAAFPSVPTLQSPGDGSTITDDTPTLEWSASSGATQYQVQVDYNPDFSSPVVDTTGPGTAYTVASGLNDDTYYWRVRAGDSIGNWSGWTPPWQFTVDTGVPPVPIIVVSGVCETNLPPDSNTVELLQISNIGDGLLTYNLSESPTAGWLWEDPTSDSLSGGESDNVDLHFDSTGLSTGIYNTTLVIDHNDGEPNPYNLSCQLNVGCTSTVYIPADSQTHYSGEVFDEEVRIADVTDLGGFELELYYDPEVVHILDITLGGFPDSTGRTWTELGPVIDNSTGMATFGGISMGSQAGASGTGVIAVISLEAQDVPALSNSPLDLEGIQVTDTGGTTIEPICVNDGSATVDNCEPVWGADFSWYDPVRTSRTTSFNSSVGGGNLPINYSWDFGDGFGNVGQIVEHTYNHGISDVHDVQVSMGATNDCGIDQEDHSIEVWFFFDFDLDCDVDIVDIMRVASRWNCDLGEPCYDEYYDIEIDNDIDIVDIMQTASWWNWACSTTLASSLSIMSLDSPDATLSIDPPSQTVSPGDTFSTTIVISDVVDLGGFEFDLSYDPDVIHVLDVTMGDFPVSTGRTWTALGPDIDNEAGLTSFGSFSFGAQAGPSGMGPVAIVTYKAQPVTATSTSQLNLEEIQVVDTGSTLIPSGDQDGDVTVFVLVENAGIVLSPDQGSNAEPGKTITYNHVLTNTGDVTDTYDLSVDSSQGWMVSVSPDPTVDSGESSTFKVTVLVPAGTLAGVQDEVILTAVSQLDPSVSATSNDTTTVNQIAGVSLSASQAKTAQPGDTVTYTHVLTNKGNGTDTFNLRAVSSHGWIVSVSPNPSVAAGETASINVTITIPNDAHNSIVDEVTLTVDSQFDPNATAFVTDTTTIVETPVTDPGEIIYLPLIEM